MKNVIIFILILFTIFSCCEARRQAVGGQFPFAITKNSIDMIGTQENAISIVFADAPNQKQSFGTGQTPQGKDTLQILVFQPPFGRKIAKYLIINSQYKRTDTLLLEYTFKRCGSFELSKAYLNSKAPVLNQSGVNVFELK